MSEEMLPFNVFSFKANSRDWSQQETSHSGSNRGKRRTIINSDSRSTGLDSHLYDAFPLSCSSTLKKLQNKTFTVQKGRGILSPEADFSGSCVRPDRELQIVPINQEEKDGTGLC